MNIRARFFAVVSLFIILANCVFAQGEIKQPPTHSKKSAGIITPQPGSLPVDPDVIIGKLPNGLTYYIRKNAQPQKRAELYLVNKVGSVLETDQQRGLAHFTEHMAFKGTRDFPKNDLINYLQKSGVRFGADLNAYTSFDETVYLLPLPTDSVKIFERGFDILQNWAGGLTLDSLEINSERGVVLEEKRLRGKNAAERMQLQLLPVYLNNSRYAQRLPIGDEDIIKKFSPSEIKSFYHDWYRPDLQAVIAVGDFDPSKIEELIKKKFSGLKNPVNEKKRVEYNVPATKGTTVKMVTDKEYPYVVAQIIIKHPENVVRTEADYLQKVRVDLFNQMINARLGEIIQKSNPPFLFAQASYASFLAKQDALSISVLSKSVSELQKALEAAVNEVERAHKFGFTSTEFERAKQKSLATIESKWKEKDKTSSVEYVRSYQQNFLQGAAIPGIEFEYDFYKKHINDIKLAEVNAFAGKFISDQNRVVIVNAPDKEKDALPTEAQLLNWINTSGRKITPYIDDVGSGPLLAKQPQAGKIIAEVKDTLINTTTLQLSNGVKVILKPTDFKNDQILLKAFSFGGTSLASDQDFVSANLSSSIISNSGVAKLNQIQLNKMLTGKSLHIAPFINETTEGISGNSTPKDLETALQLVYLYFTEPRKDADIWQAKIAEAKALLANRGLEPLSVYADTVYAVLGNYNYRAMPNTPEKLNAANLDKAYNFYKARFADASGFTFTFVGSFDTKTIKPLLEKYLGALPAAGHTETYKNLNIHAPNGQFVKNVYKGIGDKSTVELVFGGDFQYNDQNNLQMSALEEIMNIKLTERLRQKESGVYSPGVYSTHTKLPVGRYSFTVFFTCAPDNVEKLINSTIEEITNIKQNGAQLTDIQKFQASNRRSTEVKLKDNSFWLNTLSGYAQNAESADIVLNHIDDLNKVTVQTTKEAANKYLNGENLIKFILYPEKK